MHGDRSSATSGGFSGNGIYSGTVKYLTHLVVSSFQYSGL